MKETARVTIENTEEFQALENELKILARMIVRTVMREILLQGTTVYKGDVEPTTLSPKMNSEQEEQSLLLNVRDGARLLRVSRSRVYELVHARQIPSVRFGKRILIPRAQLARFIEETAKDSMNTDW